eukprot:12432257-Alexandrium_andersonii.AAC.1
MQKLGSEISGDASKMDKAITGTLAITTGSSSSGGVTLVKQENPHHETLKTMVGKMKQGKKQIDHKINEIHDLMAI